MILIDFNGIAIGNVVVQRLAADENLIRHMILNSIRMYRQKFHREYGEVVIVADGAGNWRKDAYPQYKASRKKSRDESSIDWTEMFRIINMIRDEIRDNFPYKVMHQYGCEADDVIAQIAMETQEFGKHEPVMIVSADKDFIQLQKYDNIKQFSPMTKKFVEDKNPRTYIMEHIFKGDSGDGVPNVLSPDNTFVDGIRQSPVTKKKIESWVANIEDLQSVMDEATYRNYCRNKKLIDLSETPADIKQNIINIYNGIKPPHKMKVLNFLIKKRCKMLIESVEEFY